MKVKTPLLFFSFLLMMASCNSQENKGKTQNNSSSTATLANFIIGDYMIVPKEKIIKAYTMIGGVDWDGFEYRKDSIINYETTTLLLLGNQVVFKEHFPFDYNVDKLKIIHRDEFYFLCKDDKNIYYTSPNLKPTKIDISGYQAVNDFIYKSKSGALFFVDIEAYKLSPVSIDIDVNSIKHLASNYYSDKNGLYFFGEHSKKNSKGYYDNYIEKSEKLVDAKNVVPTVSKKYITFNNLVFAIDNNQITPINIDPKKIIEINFVAPESFITDGRTVYSDMNYGYDEGERNEKGYYGIWYPTLFSNVDIQEIYSPLLHFTKEKNIIVFNKNDPNNFPGLIAKINNEHYLLANKKKSKIDKMEFYHPETKTNELFDEKYLKIYKAERFIQYKSALYFDGIPVKTDLLEMQNLREVENSNYLTDGKSVLYIGGIGGYKSQEKNGVEYADFDENILKDVFSKGMKVVNPDVLSDGITLVSKNQQANIKALNLKVKVVE